MHFGRRNRRYSCSALMAAIWMAAPLCVSHVCGDDESAAELIAIQAGELPIVISAPHGGVKEIPGVPARRGEGLPKGPQGFTATRDFGTEELAREVSAEIERRYQRKPYFVISQAHRRYLDPNRPMGVAYEDPDAKPVYDRYHRTLAEYCRDVQRRFRAGLLLDLHGQSSRADTVFRGSKNGLTVQLLRQRHGEGAHFGDASLMGWLRERGWNVHPDPLDAPEQAGFTGGYIVQTYGSHQSAGIDAVQLELGAEFRSSTRRQHTARTLADAVVVYAEKYLDISPPTATQDDRIEVALYVGAGTSSNKIHVVKALQQLPQLAVREVTAGDIRGGKLAGIDVLIQPGGSGSRQGKELGEEGRAKIREFVAEGGGFVGICAGAYLATCDYDWSLHILDAKVVDRQHWARGSGTVDVGLSPRGQAMLGTSTEKVSMFYFQGPLLAPAHHPEIADYEPLAVYQGEIAENGAPKGVMPGTTAIAAGDHGKGRVVCFSPHPERSPGLEVFLSRAVLWSSGRVPETGTK